jgi:hypothetical protein
MPTAEGGPLAAFRCRGPYAAFRICAIGAEELTAVALMLIHLLGIGFDEQNYLIA